MNLMYDVAVCGVRLDGLGGEEVYGALREARLDAEVGSGRNSYLITMYLLLLLLDENISPEPDVETSLLEALIASLEGRGIRAWYDVKLKQTISLVRVVLLN